MREEFFTPFHSNPEAAYLAKYSNQESPLTDAEEKVYDYLRQSNSGQEWAYTAGDEKLLKKYTEKFGDKTQRGEMLEAILVSQFEESEWLGGECTITQCSEFDDVINGIDMVAEFENEDGKVVLLGIDATTTFSKERLEWKVERIFKEIERQNLGKLNYFSSEEHPEIDKNVEMVPKVIIKVDELEVSRLSSMIKDMIDGKKGSAKELGKCRLQMEILKEIKDQLEAQIYYATNIFLDTVEHSLNGGMKIDKEQAMKFNKIIASYEKRDINDLQAVIEDNKDVLSLFGGFNEKIIYKLQEIFLIIENLVKEKENTLKIDFQDIKGDENLRDSLKNIEKDRFKNINLSPLVSH